MAGLIVDGVVMTLFTCRQAYPWTARSRAFSLLARAAVGRRRFTLERWLSPSSDRFSSFRQDLHSLGGEAPARHPGGAPFVQRTVEEAPDHESCGEDHNQRLRAKPQTVPVGALAGLDRADQGPMQKIENIGQVAEHPVD